MSIPDKVERMGKVFEAFAQGNAAPFFESLHDDVVWNITAPLNNPWYGLHRGKADFIQTFQAALQALAFDRFEVHDILGSGDLTVELVSERFTVLATGKTVEQDAVLAQRWRDGQIIEYREYNDTAAFAEAFAP